MCRGINTTGMKLVGGFEAIASHFKHNVAKMPARGQLLMLGSWPFLFGGQPE
jgi:hypothetical protein